MRINNSIILLFISILPFIGAYFIRKKYVFELVGYLKGNKLIEQAKDKNKLAKDFSYVYIGYGISALVYAILNYFSCELKYSSKILALGFLASVFLQSHFRKKLEKSLY